MEVIAVNAGDSAETINKYVDANKFTFKVVMGGKGNDYTVGKAYGIQAYPTNYLIGADGKVIWRGVGFDETAIRNAMEKTGIK